jgi:hypothetical protein
MADSVECLFTTVKNVSGSEKYFGFLPPHGKRLAANEEVTILGDLVTRVARSGPHSYTKRPGDALQRALLADLLVIMKTPAVHLYDETLDETKALSLDNGSLGVVDPCWGSFSSSA